MPETKYPSLVRSMPMEDYLAHPALSRSTLGVLAEKSPAHAKWNMENPSEGTHAMELGTAIHAALLEPELYREKYIVAPPCGLMSTNKAKDRWEEWVRTWYDGEVFGPRRTVLWNLGGKTILAAKDGEVVTGILSRVFGNPALKSICSAAGDYEMSMFWEHEGVACKGRIDKWYRSDKGLVVVDVKSTVDASKAAMSKSISKFGYHRQAAWYRQGLDATIGHAETIHHLLLCFEKTPPYALAAWTMDPAAVQIGAEENEKLLSRWKTCVENDDWPDYTRTGGLVGLPRWHDLNL